MILTGTYTSVWEEGTITTPGTLNTETGEVTGDSTDEGVNFHHLIREFFTDSEENEYEICTACHSFIMKTVMTPDKHSNMISEESVCMGSCESW